MKRMVLVVLIALVLLGGGLHVVGARPDDGESSSNRTPVATQQWSGRGLIIYCRWPRTGPSLAHAEQKDLQIEMAMSPGTTLATYDGQNCPLVSR